MRVLKVRPMRSSMNILIVVLIDIASWCNFQLVLGQSNSHHQDQNSFTNNLEYQKLSSNKVLNMSRPLERPSLNMVSRDQNFGTGSGNAASIRTESPADWFVMGGAAEDLLAGEGKSVASISLLDQGGRNSSAGNLKRSGLKRKNSKGSSSSANKTMFDEDSDASDSNEIFDDVEDGTGLAGTQKEPECASHGRYYCTFKEDYPLKLVTEVTKYYKWPLEKLFRDLHAQIMPKLAQDSTGNLVCDSITRVVRPGWARNTNDRWLVVINTENYHQYVTEVLCQYGSNSRCNFIPPCYYSSCQQRYNTQKLLVIDPTNPYRGPFLSEFLFPSCCVCYVPSSSDTYQDKYRSSPSTIYQRTMQQESANNLYPPQFKPSGLMEEPLQGSLVDQSQSSQRISPSSSLPSGSSSASAQMIAKLEAANNQTPGEIRRSGEQYSWPTNDRAQSRGPERQQRFMNLDLGEAEMTSDAVVGQVDNKNVKE